MAAHCHHPPTHRPGFASLLLVDSRWPRGSQLSSGPQLAAAALAPTTATATREKG
jgi:hypothetical protein